jgi:S1-C subfamily serine protease
LGGKVKITPMRILVAMGLLLALFSTAVYAEDVRLQRAVPFGILNRVFPLKFGEKNSGACFVVDVDDRQYIVTARHLVPGIAASGLVEVFVNQKWHGVRVRPIFPENPKTDIVALAADQLLAPRMDIVAGDRGIFVGQDVYFLGFPFGLASKFAKPSPTHIAFIKKAVLSAIDALPESGHVLYLDGHNNPGFSGGPVIFANYNEGERLQIAGVVAGYRNQPTEVHEVEVQESDSPTSERGKRIVRYVRENTGIVVAFSFSEIEKAIKSHPIGPLLPAPAE